MIAASEAECLLKLKLNGVDSLNQNELYRAIVYQANAGFLLPEFEKLNFLQRILIEVRYCLAKSDLSKAEILLASIESAEIENLTLVADIYYLKALVDFRNGQLDKYFNFMNLAKNYYLKDGDDYRYLRAAINVELVKQDAAINLDLGILKVLASTVISKGFLDLAANIYKSDAIERIRHKQFKTGIESCKLALHYYQFGGCPEDISLVHALYAILLFLDGKYSESSDQLTLSKITSGKVKDYLSLYQNLKLGKSPELPVTHTLYNVNWSSFVKNKNSITQKVVSELRKEPLTKYQIIERVWGLNAAGPAYEARLFNVLQKLKKQDYLIVFDGEKYNLGS